MKRKQQRIGFFNRINSFDYSSTNKYYSEADASGVVTYLIPKSEIDNGKIKIIFHKQGVKVPYYDVKGVENVPNGVYYAIKSTDFNDGIVLLSSYQNSTIWSSYLNVPNFAVLADNQGTGKYLSPDSNTGGYYGGTMTSKGIETGDNGGSGGSGGSGATDAKKTSNKLIYIVIAVIIFAILLNRKKG